ncbi:MAG: class I SAM-dependent methyltransferase [Planctomycetes bacterium]|nr:class I SAM-dependent methyltransferase [Planctomycetota bacterium]
MSQQPTTTKPDYVLGTHDEELARLGRQHALWQADVMEAWRRAGIKAGSYVIDVGAGPGFVTTDLAKLVGPTGHVTAVEISPKYVQTLKERVKTQGFTNVDAHVVDLMHDPIPLAHGPFDAAWCRWVAMFVPDLAALVGRIHDALKPGGVVVFHEYVLYETFGAFPPDEAIADYVREVVKSFRANGGEPSPAGKLLGELRGRGYQILAAKPLAKAAQPHEPFWSWQAEFIRTYVPRLREFGQVDDAWCAKVLRALETAEKNPNSVVMMPTVMEIAARKQPSK